MEKTFELSKSLEDYLEVIFRIIKSEGTARITDIAAAMDVAASSVNEMVAKLKKKELVRQQKYGPVQLTAKGRELAEKIDCTHEIIFKFLYELLEVDKETANHDACLIEHSISDQTLIKLINFLTENNIIDENNNCFLDYYKLKLGGQAKMDTNTISFTLDQLKSGDIAEVFKITGSGRIRRKLMDMGLNRGARLEIKGKAPMGDPIEVKVRDYNLTLRKEEAEKVKVVKK
ncbi:MAG: DtxR family transcriptional regulator [Halanaerobium sp.]